MKSAVQFVVNLVHMALEALSVPLPQRRPSKRQDRAKHPVESTESPALSSLPSPTCMPVLDTV